MNKLVVVCLFILTSFVFVRAQQPALELNEKKVPLTETAIAFDAIGGSALEARLAATNLTGSPESPVTNVRVLVRNSSSTPFAFVAGIVTFYDSSGIRCAEAVFKSEALAVGEQFETDIPGIRIRCAPTSWRVVASSLVPRTLPVNPEIHADVAGTKKLIISIDGEQHPIQFNKPIKLSLGDKERTIIVREEP